MDTTVRETTTKTAIVNLLDIENFINYLKANRAILLNELFG